MTNPYQPPQGQEPQPQHQPPAQPQQYSQPPQQQQPQQYGQQYGQQPAVYPQPVYQQPAYGYPAAPPTNTLAVVSLVASLATLVLGVTAIVGVITGHMALGQIKRTGEGGRGMAVAGLIIGYVFVGFGVLAIVVGVIAAALGIFLPLAFLSGTTGVDAGFA